MKKCLPDEKNMAHFARVLQTQTKRQIASTFKKNDGTHTTPVDLTLDFLIKAHFPDVRPVCPTRHTQKQVGSWIEWITHGLVVKALAKF